MGGVAHDVLYRSLFEHALMEVHIWQVVRDAAGAIVTWRLVDANRTALRSWGRSLDDVVGRTTEEIFPDADPVGTFLPIVEEITRTGRAKEWEVDFPGTAQVLHMISIPVGDYFVSTGFDVTAHRTLARELREALHSLNQAIQAGGVGLWDWDLRTDKVRYSDEWKRQLGHAPGEIADDFEEWRSRVHPDDLESTLERVRATIADPARPHDVVFRMRHRDGSWRWILAQGSIIRGEDGSADRMVGSHVDITERRRLEDRVRESEKLEALGTLSAGIAHDFNNLLGAMAGNLAMIRGMAPEDPEIPVLLKELDDATQRATALTRQLLTFAKGGSPVRDVASIRELLIESATFLTRGSACRCEFDVAEDLDAVNADVGQLSQVIDNLVINAMQAMPGGGRIVVRARNVTLRDGDPSGLPAGRYVRLSVEDEGSGIPADHLSRIFDPFFTTKSAGSGLGLSSSYSIVARHGGRITVVSEPGRGTIFDVHLPASSGAPQAPPEAQVVRGTGRILVMDDDAAIRSVVQRMVRRLGYHCDVCADGREAIERYAEARAAGRPFDAVILDLTVPGGLGGAATLPELMRLDPDVVAIVSSGYAEDDILAHHEQHGFRGRIQKPVSLGGLSVELARALGRMAGR